MASKWSVVNWYGCNSVPCPQRKFHCARQNDTDVTACSQCWAPFKMLLRRHHCRKCGQIFCYKCAPKTVGMPGKMLCCLMIPSCKISVAIDTPCIISVPPTSTSKVSVRRRGSASRVWKNLSKSKNCSKIPACKNQNSRPHLLFDNRIRHQTFCMQKAWRIAPDLICLEDQTQFKEPLLRLADIRWHQTVHLLLVNLLELTSVTVWF